MAEQAHHRAHRSGRRHSHTPCTEATPGTAALHTPPPKQNAALTPSSCAGLWLLLSCSVQKASDLPQGSPVYQRNLGVKYFDQHHSVLKKKIQLQKKDVTYGLGIKRHILLPTPFPNVRSNSSKSIQPSDVFDRISMYPCSPAAL